MFEFIICLVSSSVIFYNGRVYSIPRQAIAAVCSDKGWDHITLWIERTHTRNYDWIGCIEVAVGRSKWRMVESIGSGVVVDYCLVGSIRRCKVVLKEMRMTPVHV